MNITALLYDTVKTVGGRTAIIENGKEISYDDLLERIERLSVSFYKIGIKERQRVALILSNGSEFICCFFALLKVNAIVTPLSTELTPCELKSIFNNLNPYAIISTSIFINKILEEIPALVNNRMLILQDSTDAGVKIKNCYELKSLYNLFGNYKIGNIQTADDHVATINYTYRGLGYPLGAMLSHKNYIEAALIYMKNIGIVSQHSLLSVLPLSHVYPLVCCILAPLFAGATIIVSKNYMPRSILKIIDTYKISYLTAVPSIYILLLQNNGNGIYDLNSLTCCLTGGAYMSQEIQEAVRTNMRAEVLQGYGLTECLTVAMNTYENNKMGTLGLPFRCDFMFKIIGDNGMPKGMNEVGEIVISSPTVMQGYYNQQDETTAIFKDGWFYTGDYGYLDGKGYLHFAGLKKNVAKVGGNMVDLKEVKEALLSHPAISHCLVSSKEDDLWGHVVVAEVVSRDNRKLAENELKAFCSKRLSRYKIPKAVEFIRGN